MKKIKVKNLIFNSKENGFGLIEIVITATILTIAFVGFVSFILFSRSATSKAQRNTEAVSIAEEAVEVVRKLRDDSWSTNIANKVSGTTYYPNISGSSWVLQTTNPNPSSYYTTRIVFSDVNRDANDNISTTGTNDPGTKKVDVTVTWNEAGTKTVSLTTYITNFRNN